MTEKQIKLKNSLDHILKQISTPFPNRTKKLMLQILENTEVRDKLVINDEDLQVQKVVRNYITEKLKVDLSLDDFRYLCLMQKMVEGKPAKLDSVLYRDEVE